jgi:YidC/Oxa1 family membrane protein insertase
VQFLETILSPLIFVLALVLGTLQDFTGSYGIAIILLSAFVAIVTYPLSVQAQRIELRDKQLHQQMASKLQYAKANFKGEQQFNEIEKSYIEHNYHPIKSVKSATGFAFQLPFLLSSLLLLWGFQPLAGQSFLFLADLSQPDAFLSLGASAINVLPLIMVAITLCETAIKPELTVAGRIKFSFITLTILVLIYTLPSAVVLFWTSNSTISLARTLIRRLGV